MTDLLTIELCETIGQCSADLGNILLSSNREIGKCYDADSGLFENFGYILAVLFVGQGLNIDEVANCIACFVGCNNGTRNDFENIAHSFDFYTKQVVYTDDKNGESFFRMSCICYNLLNPKSWNNFNSSIPYQEINIPQMTSLIIAVTALNNKVIPTKINPILEKL